MYKVSVNYRDGWKPEVSEQSLEELTYNWPSVKDVFYNDSFKSISIDFTSYVVKIQKIG